MNVAIIGCGLIGQKRSKALGACQVVVCADLVKQKADGLARIFLSHHQHRIGVKLYLNDPLILS